MKYSVGIIIISSCTFASCGSPDSASVSDTKKTSGHSHNAPPKPKMEVIPFSPPPASDSSEEVLINEEPNEYTPYKVEWIDKLDSLFPFYSKRVDSIIANRMIFKRELAFGYDSYDLLHRNEIKTLSPSELLYYCLTYPCSYYQNCNPWPELDKGAQLYLYPMLPTPEDGHGLSELQAYHFAKNKDTLSTLLGNFISQSDTVALECLQLIHSKNLYKLIPLLCQKADFKKTPYCCTVLYNFMASDEKNSYKPFISSTFYKRLSHDDWGRMKVKKSDLVELTKWAMKFYEYKTK